MKHFVSEYTHKKIQIAVSNKYAPELDDLLDVWLSGRRKQTVITDEELEKIVEQICEGSKKTILRS